MSDNLNWLERFRGVYKPLLLDRYDEFEEALRSEKSRHVRLNLCRGADYLQELAPFVPTQIPNLKGVYKINIDGDKITDTISFQTGGIYIMNPSSVVPPMLLSHFMPDHPLILDVSAAPGGKTCALSDFLCRRGLIVANEVSSARMKSLHFNLEKYGCFNVKTISRDGRLLHKIFPNSFDGVLLDAPCSNENKIFRNKTVSSSWNNTLVERMATLQKQLILSAFDCLVDGGVLVYSTCTMSVDENEKVVAYLLKERCEASLIQIDGFSGGGFSGETEIDEKIIRITPSKDVMDGFFVAVFRKSGAELENRVLSKSKLTLAQVDFFKNNFDRVPENIKIGEVEGRGYMEPSFDPFPKIPFSRRGLNLYRLAKDGLEPSCQSVWELSAKLADDKRTDIEKNSAIEYLKGFDIEKPPKYNTRLLFSFGLPVGYGKIVDGKIKNKLDRYFLFGKNIEW